MIDLIGQISSNSRNSFEILANLLTFQFPVLSDVNEPQANGPRDNEHDECKTNQGTNGDTSDRPSRQSCVWIQVV